MPSSNGNHHVALSSTAPMTLRDGHRDYGAVRLRYRPVDPRYAQRLLWAGLVVVVAYAVLCAALMERLPYADWAPLWLIPVLLLVSLPILRATIAGEKDRITRVLVIAGLAVKIGMAFANYAIETKVYVTVDATGYDHYGAILANWFRQGNFNLSPLSVAPHDFSDRVMYTLTGVLYGLFGHSELMMFVLFAWFAYLGLCLFYRAFRIGLPRVATRRYAMLLFLWPSLAFWTAALGKDALTMFGLGVTVFGAARILKRRASGYVYLVLGSVVIDIVRPQISLIVYGGLFCAMFVRQWRNPHRTAASNFAMVTMGVIGAAGFLVFIKFFHVSATSAGSVLNRASQSSSVGQSSIAGGLTPQNIALVLFRPLPNQITSLAAAMAGIESIVLFGLIVASWRRLITAWKWLLKVPYVTLAAGSALLFDIAFSVFSNAGLLDRERAQLWPFVFVLLSLTPAVRQPRRVFAPRSQPPHRQSQNGSQPAPVPIGPPGR